MKQQTINEQKDIHDSMGDLHVLRDFSLTTKAVDVLMSAKREYSYKAGVSITTNKMLSLILEHYGYMNNKEVF